MIPHRSSNRNKIETLLTVFPPASVSLPPPRAPTSHATEGRTAHPRLLRAPSQLSISMTCRYRYIPQSPAP
ncbi:hypothetical protein LZ30DRAFT_734901 [Colletotrichum cereale]|nr:hypothetical protein LZ30DRAFT_734901 [Colletotrichum cereale]